jgi:hypothetical protein
VEKTGTWLRRIGFSLVGLNVVVEIALVLFGRVAFLGLPLRGLFFFEALMYLGGLIGFALLAIGLVWGGISSRRRRESASFRWEIAAAIALTFLASTSTLSSRQPAHAVYVPRDKPAPSRAYRVLYPNRTSAEPGDLELRLGQEATIGGLRVTITKTQRIERHGVFDTYDHGWYLIVFYRVTNDGPSTRYFLNAAEWSFDVPGKGRAEVVFPTAPMEADSLSAKLAPGRTIDATVALFLGTNRRDISRGNYYAIWEPEGGCAVSDANYLPFGNCRGVWPVDEM